MPKYDIAIAYRIYPGISKVPPIFSDDKYKLSELCLASFQNALNGINYKLYVILDNCPDEYLALFSKYFDGSDVELITVEKSGNAKTFGMQMDMLLKQEDAEIIYFAEDDYFYLPNAFSEMLNFMHSENKPDFISPFDHLDYYTLKLHDYNYNTIQYSSCNWRTAATTCMTFMTSRKILKKSEKIFRSYTHNNYDASLWMTLTKINVFSPSYIVELLKQGGRYQRILMKMWFFGFRELFWGTKYKLYVPKPSLSTHMDNLCLAPDIDWDLEFAKLLKKFNFSDK